MTAPADPFEDEAHEEMARELRVACLGCWIMLLSPPVGFLVYLLEEWGDRLP